MIVDILGFQDPNACGRQDGASFRDFCDNYAQERLQLLFHESTFTSQQDKYAQVTTSVNKMALTWILTGQSPDITPLGNRKSHSSVNSVHDIKGAWQDPNFIPHLILLKLRFWYQKKAHIFLINFRPPSMLHIDGMNKQMAMIVLLHMFILSKTLSLYWRDSFGHPGRWPSSEWWCWKFGSKKQKCQVYIIVVFTGWICTCTIMYTFKPNNESI